MDISTRADIEKMVNSFYEKVKKDEVIGYIFNDVIKLNWEQHLPVMFDFWETILLNEQKYTRNAMGVHFEVNRKTPLEKKHFDRWMKLFTETVDELFSGDVANMAKTRARSIADVMFYKMTNESGLSNPKVN